MTPELWEVYEQATHSYGCTREFIEYFEDPAGASIALVRPAPRGHVRAAFLFKMSQDRSVRVLGRFTAPPAEILGAYVDAVFARNRAMRRVDTGLIDALPDPGTLGRPVLAQHTATEMRISLPDSVEEYQLSLDKDFLKRTQRFEHRLSHACPSSRFVAVEREEIPRSWVADVVRLNHERMDSKRTQSVLDVHYEEGIFSVARAHGCLTALLDGDHVCAGVIAIRCGTDAFAWVVGHDNAYGSYRPGKLCQLASIRHCIARGVRTLHFLHGESRYKKELGGKPASLASYVVLRSWAALRPDEVTRLLWTRSEASARKLIDVADAIAARALDRKEPVKSFARDVARRVKCRLRESHPS
jgi:CelD/BcsL family acetyltransferase involved in cellulose biosynthesis